MVRTINAPGRTIVALLPHLSPRLCRVSTWSWIFLVIVLVLLLAMLLTRRTRGGVDPTQLLLDPDLVTQVRALAQQNQKIAAIKMLREGTPGLGLASAKVMVDRMARPPATGRNDSA